MRLYCCHISLPSQTASEFANFLENFEKCLYQIQAFRSSFVVILGDFNVKPKSWCNEDITSNEGSQIDSLAATYGLQQSILDPNHIWQNSSTCIDLIFTDQPNLIVDSGVHPSLHTNFHHQIAFWKFNFINEYSAPYQRLIWDYKTANVNSIKQALYQVNWSTILSNKDVHQQLNIMNSIMLNVFTNYVSNKVITIDDEDPFWMTDFIKSSIKWPSSIYKLFKKVPIISQNIIHCNRLLQKYLTWYMIKRMITTMPLPKNCQTLQLVSKHTGLYRRPFIILKRCQLCLQYL